MCSNDLSRHYVILLSTAGASRPAVFLLPQVNVPVAFDLQSAACVSKG